MGSKLLMADLPSTREAKSDIMDVEACLVPDSFRDMVGSSPEAFCRPGQGPLFLDFRGFCAVRCEENQEQICCVVLCSIPSRISLIVTSF